MSTLGHVLAGVGLGAGAGVGAGAGLAQLTASIDRPRIKTNIIEAMRFIDVHYQFQCELSQALKGASAS